MPKEKLNLEPLPAEYFDKVSGAYMLPFIVLDPTPGGKNIGRIEWIIEPIERKKKQGRWYITKLLVCARQTHDPRWSGKLFYVDLFTEALTGNRQNGDGFFNGVWLSFYCAEHRNSMQFLSYPKNHHKHLRIETYSSIMCDIKYV